MSFDTLGAKKLINNLRAFTRMPGGDLMGKAADALFEAVTDATKYMSDVRSAEAESMKYKKDYESALLEIKALREKDKEREAAVGVLTEIAKMKKGAAVRAHEWLLGAGKIKEPEAPQ